jgi:hypothetical protein
MPILECLNIPLVFPGQPTGRAQLLPINLPVSLVAHGPSVLVEIGFETTLFQATSDATAPSDTVAVMTAPAVRTVLALVDTGAAPSCIDDDLAQELKLPLINVVKSGGVGGSHFLSQYLCKLSIPQLGFSRAGPFLGAKLAQGGQIHRALIGRDFLASMLLVYDGTSGRVKLSV